MRIRLFDSVAALARDAAADAASSLVRQLSAKASVRLVAATGSTQIAFLEALVASPGIDWSRVELFHLDEYLGIGASHPASFARFIRERIVEPAGIGRAHLMDGLADPADLIRRLDEELARAPVDLAFTGVGENGHLAFNEPPAMFTTDARFMPVELDEVSGEGPGVGAEPGVHLFGEAALERRRECY